jgi:hypothetical protein
MATLLVMESAGADMSDESHVTRRPQDYGNHIHASTISFIVLGANNPTPMTTMPDAMRETDKTVSGHPPRLRSKLWNSAFMTYSSQPMGTQFLSVSTEGP